jgi:hypothetical protein
MSLPVILSLPLPIIVSLPFRVSLKHICIPASSVDTSNGDLRAIANSQRNPGSLRRLRKGTGSDIVVLMSSSDMVQLDQYRPLVCTEPT